MKPLLITDCDEVLLHMVRHFGSWLDEAHDIEFAPTGGDFANSEFKDAVKNGDAPRLRALAECDLDSVKRSTGGSSAIVLFGCPAAGGKTSTAVMIMFSSGKAVSIEPMSFVRVPERG